MSRSDNDPGPAAGHRRLSQALQDLGRARRNFIYAESSAGADDGVTRAFHAAVLNLWSELRPYRDVKDVEEVWEDCEALPEGKGLEDLRDAIGMRRAVESASPGHRGGRHRETEPATFDGQRLLELSFVLDDIARELGFTPDVDEPLPHEEDFNPVGEPDE